MFLLSFSFSFLFFSFSSPPALLFCRGREGQVPQGLGERVGTSRHPVLVTALSQRGPNLGLHPL